MGIFSDFAPAYWNAGLPVIPLRTKNKMPDITAWSAYGSEMPSEAVRAHWVASFPNGNIGLPFGPASGLCAIDIDMDVEDETNGPLLEAIMEILPPTPWVRVGKKGMGLIYRWAGQKNFKLRGEDGGMILEFLGLGNQMVMPPSIHPDTQRPYTSNTNLWEVMDQIEEIDEDIEDKLRALLGKAGFSLGAGGRSAPLDVIPAGERDVQMVRHAGYLARVVLGIDKSVSFGLWSAIQHMYTWVTDFTAKVTGGDDMDPDKGVAKLLEFLIKDLEKGRTLPEGWDADLPDQWRDHATVKLLSEKNDAARWTVSRGRDWLNGKVAENSDNDDWVGARVEELIGLVAADENFSEFQMRQLIPHVMRIAKGLELKKTDLMQAYKQAKKGIDGEEWEDHETIAGIVLEEMQRNGEVRYDSGVFWQWSGSCFQPLEDADVQEYVMTTVKGSALLRRNSDYASVVNVLRVKCRKALMQERENGLNFANGFVGEDLRILDHDPKFGATFTLPFYYRRDAASRAVKWFEFLHSVWGHKEDFAERVMLLQEMFAVTMFKLAPKFQKAFLLYGRAGTGKTVILNVLRSMMPPAAIAALGPEHWAEQFSATDLVGKAVNVCGELPESQVIAGNKFKEIIEGSPIRTSYKGRDGFTFLPVCAHWFGSNFLPMSRDSSKGFIRRWLILDFDRVVPESEQVKDLAEIMVAEEREAIAAWALEGLRRILESGTFTQCPSNDSRVAQMRRINNSVFAFLETGNGIVRAEGEMRARDLYDMYSFHMKDVGRGMPVSFERFNQMLDDLDLETDMRADATGTNEWWVKGVVKRDRQEG